MIYLLALSSLGNFLLTRYRMGVSVSDRLLPMSLDRVHAFARMPFLSQLPLERLRLVGQGKKLSGFQLRG